MHAFVPAGMARHPGLVGGEAGDGGEPGAKTVEHRIENRARRTPAQGIQAVAIEAVFAHIEVEGRQVDGAEIVKLGEQVVELEVLAGLAHQAVQFPHPVQDPALELRHVAMIDPFAILEAAQIPEKEPQRVAQPPVDIGVVLEDIGADAKILGII